MRLPLPSAVAFTLSIGLAVSCGSTATDPEQSDSGGAPSASHGGAGAMSAGSDGGAKGSLGGAESASGGNDGTGGSVPVPSCDGARAFPLWGKRYDAENDCIETETAVEGLACKVVPDADATPEERSFSDGFVCLRNKRDGESFWFLALNRLGYDTSIWERCPEAGLIAPKGCYAAGCREAPRSTCSLEQTRQQFACSATGEYDEDCCGRATCAHDTDCADNERCAQVMSLGQLYCWDNPGNPCDCGGPRGGPNKMLCMPR